MALMTAVPFSPSCGEQRDDRARFGRLWRRPVPRRPEVTGYRVFMAIVFICVVAADDWFDRTSSADFVGPIGVIVWALTLVGSFGVGPVRAIWDATHQ
jgi:hypothetical protein